MHYYQFNIGDYASHTSRLKPIEDLAYRRMLDLYYLNEQPLSLCLSDVARELGLTDYLDEVAYVLNKFFIETESGFSQKRIDLEIKKYKSNHKSKIKAGKASAKARQSKATSVETPIEHPLNTRTTNDELNINHKPLNTNQEPLTNNQELSLKDKDLSPKVDVNLFLADEIFQHWVKTMNKGSRTSLTALRKSKINSRLKAGYPSHEIKQAIDNVAKDSFLVAGGHTDIEMICRSDTNLEKYRDAAKMSNADMKMAQRQQSIEDFSNEGNYNE
jgi:uncharacterized protein YdaU (DUF1376 family)